MSGVDWALKDETFETAKLASSLFLLWFISMIFVWCIKLKGCEDNPGLVQNVNSDMKA